MKISQSQPRFNLRPMRKKDIAEVHALEQAIFPAPWSLNSYHFEVIRKAASGPCVIEAENEKGQISIAAYIVPWRFFDEIHIANIAVAPQYRRRGLARRLVTHVIAKAAQGGARHATLEVRAGNEAAQQLYKALGFELDGRRKGYYRDNGEDAILMRRSNLLIEEKELSAELL